MSMLPVFQKLDPETLALFLQFGREALASGDANKYVKRAMRQILDQQPEPITVQAEFIKR